jgi:hypothetical protein
MVIHSATVMPLGFSEFVVRIINLPR